jgi:hypothetical protein
VILAVVLLAFYISGFYPPYVIMYFCCYLIFDFWANIFITDFPCARAFLRMSYLGVWTDFSSTCLCRISSADSSSSASYVRSFGPNVFVLFAGSLPFFVACFSATGMGDGWSLLGDGFYCYTVICGSDC